MAMRFASMKISEIVGNDFLFFIDLAIETIINELLESLQGATKHQKLAALRRLSL
jgi:hypothetical protein